MIPLGQLISCLASESLAYYNHSRFGNFQRTSYIFQAAWCTGRYAFRYVSDNGDIPSMRLVLTEKN